MNIYTLLKLVAFISMFIDHFGLIAGIAWMRVIGRLAMPIFAYLMGYGTRITKHEGRRVIKLGITALISIPLTMYTFEETILNIMATFFFFALFMYLIKKVKLDEEIWKTLLEILAVLTLCCMTIIFKFDYGWLLPLLCYIAYKSDNMIVIFISYLVLIFVYPYIAHGFSLKFHVNSYGIMAIPLIIWFMDKKENIKGRKIYKSKIITWLNRNIFYILYPLHVFILLLIKTYLLG